MNFEDYQENELSEALRRKAVIRKGKKVYKWKTNKPKGKWRVEYDANHKPHEVRITATERRKRKLAQRKGKLKRKAKKNLIQLKRKRSFIARKNMGIKYNKKIPDLASNRPSGKGAFTKLKSKVDNTLHPLMKGMKESVEVDLHKILFITENNEKYYWEIINKEDNEYSWLEEVSDIYETRSIFVMNEQEELEDFKLDNISLNQITESLLNDFDFLNEARKEYIELDEDLQESLKTNLPETLFNKINIQMIQ